MELMRHDLRQVISSINDAHAGLLIQRGLTDWEDNEKPIKKRLIRTIANVIPNDLYLLAFNRWLALSYETDANNFATVVAKVNGRLFTGLSLGGTLETGATTHHTYGMPMIAGSSIKGAVRNYTEQLFAERNEDGSLKFDTTGNSNKIIIQEQNQQILKALFGTDGDDDSQGDAGYLIWHDAWWIPMVNDDGKLLTGENFKPFVSDIVTVHHQKYYEGKPDATLDMENPVPNQQVAIQGGFYFVIEGEQKWVHFAKSLLEATIKNTGLGAKGASGYGYFVIDELLNKQIAKRYDQGAAIDDTNDPLAAIRQKIKYLNEDELVLNLSKNKNALFEQLALDKDNETDVQKVIQVVLEEFSETVAKWQNAAKKSNTEKAYKFIQKNAAK